MTADEQEAQNVVAVVRTVKPLGKVRLGILEIGDCIVIGQRLALATTTHIVKRGVAPHQDQPRRWVARRTVDRPIFQRAQARFLERFLCLIEVAEVT
jgi:hypothetical protein